MSSYKNKLDISTFTNKNTTTESFDTEEGIRMMKMEKEIVGYALDYIDKAETEGKLNEDGRLFLKNKYINQMGLLEKLINKNEKLADLKKLEEKKEQIMKKIQERIDEISKSIDSIKEDLESY
jgi:hypothetical protein